MDNQMPSVPPTTPIPVSVIVYEGMRMAPSIVCLCIVGALVHNHSVAPDVGMMGMLGILAGQLYPKNQGGSK